MGIAVATVTPFSKMTTSFPVSANQGTATISSNPLHPLFNLSFPPKHHSASHLFETTPALYCDFSQHPTIAECRCGRGNRSRGTRGSVVTQAAPKSRHGENSRPQPMMWLRQRQQRSREIITPLYWNFSWI